MEPELLTMIGGALLVGALPGWWLGRWWSGRAIAVIAGALVLVALMLVLMAQGRQGWDGLGYIAGALFLVTPAFAGVVLGGGLGIWRRRVVARAAPTDP